MKSPVRSSSTVAGIIKDENEILTSDVKMQSISLFHNLERKGAEGKSTEMNNTISLCSVLIPLKTVNVMMINSTENEHTVMYKTFSGFLSL